MKRCPRCEFVYEDDQSLCDMDGILLVFDEKQLPDSPTNSRKVTKSRWRPRVVPAIAALVLATVLALVYYVSTRRARVSPTYSPAANAVTNAPAAEAPAPKDVEVNKTGSDENVAATEELSKSKSEERLVKPNPAPRKATPKASPTQKTRNSKQTPKTDSKIGSLMKKTGRILKKPFRF
jgi:hypothetical protein